MVDRVRELLHTALHDEGGEMVEGAFVDNWISNSYTAAEELSEELTGGITVDLQATFREMFLDPKTDEETAARILAILGEDKTRRFVLELLIDADEKARAIGVRTAGQMFSEEFLAPYFTDASPQIRLVAIQTFADHRPRFSGSAQLIQSAFKDADPTVRKAAYSV